jgi:thioredoxin reductase (NADPH)
MRAISLFCLSIGVGVSSFSTLNNARFQSTRRKTPIGSALKHTWSRRSSRLFMMEVIECDVAIVGGGPAGCTCALYTSRADLKTVVLDKNPSVGALAITSHIANYPGVDKSMTGQELLDQMRKQAVDYGTDYRRTQVFMIDIEEGDDDPHNKLVYTPDGIFKARALVLATGAMGRVSPPFPGEDTYLGQGVSYCATCDGAFTGIAKLLYMV